MLYRWLFSMKLHVHEMQCCECITRYERSPTMSFGRKRILTMEATVLGEEEERAQDFLFRARAHRKIISTLHLG
ncbi:hypothetical protein MA16_Dca018226 [Dendrobium catenatum]|uniref:Uncharacterized protein n=1 Tax=Dendrobium catenatum TaxID=906689 RepID=A0A2I0XB36_9ASPA|nr:hypothetical protein MA16_Dca018226 [Dendrobium catenatum]